MKYPQARVIIMSKAPVPGEVKTRLAPLLGYERAAQLYRTLLEDTLEKALGSSLCTVELCCSPDCSDVAFADFPARYSIELSSQSEGDLGLRMSNAVEQGLRRSEMVVLTGADCPGMSAADIGAALAALDDGVDVVLGPTNDGGYYLVAMRAHYPQLFTSIPWGSSEVFELTVQQLAALGLSWHRLQTHVDLDTPADYDALQRANLIPATD